MKRRPDILCIGSVLWDVIGRTEAAMRQGNDVPGRITRLPGGVALNIAMTLRRFGLSPSLLSVVGTDPEGDELIAACEHMGLSTEVLLRDPRLPTDSYIAIEDGKGLVAAMCDAHSLEAAGDRILAPLFDGRLGSEAEPFSGPVALDGNLTEALLVDVAEHPAFRKADLRIAPASPGKATRLTPLLAHPGATLYVNLEEAGLILNRTFDSAHAAADALIAAGATRALVTDGACPAALGEFAGTVSDTPPQVPQKRVTGAGDTFMAAHIAAELKGAVGVAALTRALEAAATYVSGEDPA
ncbi:PfkB family carbohydrate kinase [Maritimibacter sp. UBA3975]|uniref:PfkB family carbohydrate kinase n=1 Tax=Maritimibacter sp. UBA3975 TaxID=1946833 RepID=UPI000C08FDF6|nr:PfkB family carbohydrate kinase [Maritimibacter sp. UBA3975]MAM60520.1 kinase [Maritimibacter sp.]|tara:strand:+ start:909 stop:1802 length:894 start_codon:yes stop_codon:yes gene_type:complete